MGQGSGGREGGRVEFGPTTPYPVGLVIWGLSSFTAVLSQSGTVTATATHAHTRIHTHTSAKIFFLCVLAGIYQENIKSKYARVCVNECVFSVMDDGLVTGHM